MILSCVLTLTCLFTVSNGPAVLALVPALLCGIGHAKMVSLLLAMVPPLSTLSLSFDDDSAMTLCLSLSTDAVREF